MLSVGSKWKAKSFVGIVSVFLSFLSSEIISSSFFDCSDSASLIVSSFIIAYFNIPYRFDTYIYYLGYDVRLESNGEEKKIETYESENGFLEINLLENMQGNITIKYAGTIIMKVSAVISGLSMLAIIFLYRVHFK